MKIQLAAELLFYIRLKCPFCQERFRCKYNIRRHLIDSHTGDEARELLADKRILKKL